VSRAAVSTLLCAVMIGLSCSVTPRGPAPPPDVAAAPKTVAPALSADVDESETPAVATIRHHIESRRAKGMTRSEIAEVAATIVAEAERYGLDPNLVVAVIHVESRFDPSAYSSAGAIGLMQILPTTGAELASRAGLPWQGPKTLFDPVQNVRLGTAYLKELSDRYGSTRVALAAYNWGPGHIDGRLRRGTPMPTVYPGLVFDAWTTRRPRRS